jgi:hypothetical protein
MGCDSVAGFFARIKDRPQKKVNPDKDNPPERHAVWPETVQGLVKLVDPRKMKDKIEELTDDQRKAVMAQSRDGAKIEGMIAEDLDGDGVEDRLYVVAFRSRELEWRAILHQRGKDLRGIKVVKESEKNNFGLVGTLDIDGDGKREVWYEEDPGSGGFEVVGELRKDGLATLVSIGCDK